jgi:hypothetical protein
MRYAVAAYFSWTAAGMRPKDPFKQMSRSWRQWRAWLATRLKRLPCAHAAQLAETDFIIRSYLMGVNYILFRVGGEENFISNNLLRYLVQDYLQSAISIVVLAVEGLLNVAKRELRFLIESSIKQCFIQQKNYETSIQEKILLFDKELSSQGISIKQNLDLGLLPEAMRDQFQDEVGRVYGLTSNYVHLTPSQLLERITSIDAGRTAGRESAAGIKTMNALLSRGLACSLVLLFHSVPSWVAGDWLVEEDGSTVSYGQKLVTA